MEVYPKDIIIFDYFRQDFWQNKNYVRDGPVGPPQHLFLVVSLEPPSTEVNHPVPTAASSAFDEL
jgi:hypothetical protein